MAVTRSDVKQPVLASPAQASNLFNPGSAFPIRQKGWFYVRFFGPESDAERENLGFVVKQVDRPGVQPTIEEANQYGRKRLIHTGIKYQPVNITFYDTTDNGLLRLWHRYASHYFGDFRQALTPDEQIAAYQDDIYGDLAGDAALGFGFSLPLIDDGNEGVNSQFYFTRVTIYQVWGGEVTAYHLINPKITSFDPDDLDYEATGYGTYRMTLDYESVLYQNNGRPFALAGSEIEDVFAPGGRLFGQVVDVPAAQKTISFIGHEDRTVAPSGRVGLMPNAALVENTGERHDNSDEQMTGGVLGNYGNYDFGSKTANDKGTVDASTTGGNKHDNRVRTDQTMKTAQGGGKIGNSQSAKSEGSAYAAGVSNKIARSDTAVNSKGEISLDKQSYGIVNQTKSSGSSQVGAKDKAATTTNKSASDYAKIIK